MLRKYLYPRLVQVHQQPKERCCHTKEQRRKRGGERVRIRNPKRLMQCTPVRVFLFTTEPCEVTVFPLLDLSSLFTDD